MLVLWVAGLSFFVQASPGVAQSGAFVLQTVEVNGTRRVDPETVIAYADLSEGTQVTPRDLNEAVRKVFASGLFEDVRIVRQGSDILIEVVENPTINEIAFEGNELISDEVLAPVLRLQPRRAFRRADAEADAQALIEAYRSNGRFNAVVTPQIIRRADNRVDIVFEIDEGEITEVEKIVFIGNRRFSDGDLRQVIETKQAGFFSTFFRADNYNSDRLELDQELLRQFYLNEGHADFRVRSTVSELNTTRDAFFLTFTIEEGPIYSFGSIEVTSQTPGLEPETLRAGLTMQEGDQFDQSQIEDSISAMDEIAGEQGYPFSQIVPRVRRDDEALTVSLVFEAAEGPRAFVERIDIVGNTRTLDRVIRREFDLVEGDAFDARALAQTVDRLRALGFFSNVDVTTRRGRDEDSAIVRTEVEDQLTGSVNFGVTFASNVGLGVVTSLAENNLLGRGQRLALDLSVDGESRSTGLSLTEPRFLDRDLALGFEIYDRQFDRSTAAFQERNLGFEPNISFPISERGRLRLAYRISEDEIFDATDTDSVSLLIRQDEGIAITSSLRATYSLDYRNSRVAPTKGFFLSLTGEVAGLGGQAEYLKGIGRIRFHTAFTDEIPAFIEFEGGLVEATDRTRITDRFFLGGSSFRGFAFGGIGPRDVDTSGATQVDSSLGGNAYGIVRLQTSFPVGLGSDSGIHGGVFLNAGSLWHLDNPSAPAEPGVRGAFTVDDSPLPRVSGGVTLFWDSAIGPLRVDFARSILRQDGDETESFRLGAGRRY
ncbi:MAG: outer membrane protein assembly factor BamA [Pseudomonadota bacterium]